MSGKAADHPRKTTVKPRKNTVNPRISGPCYKSFRLNGDVFCRNSAPARNLVLPQGGVEFMCNAGNDLRPNSTHWPRLEFHKMFSSHRLWHSPTFSRGAEV
jgi:hypothetical protein